MKLLLYCTKSKPYLYQGFARPMHTLDIHNPFNYKWHLMKKTKTSASLNGKIVAECDFEVKELKYSEELLKKSCLTASEIFEYIKKSNTAYAIHIKNLHIFDEPKELSNYRLEKAPQNMMYVNHTEKVLKKLLGKEFEAYKVTRDVLISIHPEWLCKELNGEKEIEVRKIVLKEMLKNGK